MPLVTLTFGTLNIPGLLYVLLILIFLWPSLVHLNLCIMRLLLYILLLLPPALYIPAAQPVLMSLN